MAVKRSSEKIPDGKHKLSDLSDWFSYYEDEVINVPGQDVKIASFDESMRVLRSIRKPKKITIYGMNEKSYNFLVKGIEDLRLD